MAAADFFTVEVVTGRGLVRYLVFFVLKLETREVRIAGISPVPTGAWMMQLARNLTDVEDGFLCGINKLILDRDPLYTRAFRSLLRGSGVQCIRLPARSPNLNAYAERFVLSIKRECLGRLVLLGEGHLRHAVGEYVAHDHLERPHQGLENLRILPLRGPSAAAGPVERRERLGGMLSHYYRRAA